MTTEQLTFSSNKTMLTITSTILAFVQRKHKVKQRDYVDDQFTHEQNKYKKRCLTKCPLGELSLLHMFIIESIVNSLNVGIIALECLQSSVKEVSISNIYKDYMVTL